MTGHPPTSFILRHSPTDKWQVMRAEPQREGPGADGLAFSVSYVVMACMEIM